MADLMETLQQFLGTEEGQSKLNEVASMLNQDGNNGLDLDALGAMLGGAKESTPPEEEHTGAPDLSSLDLGGLDINMLLKMKNMMGALSRKNDDKNVQLIYALKPHLAPERRKKADEALRIMKLIEFLPMIQQSGLLNGIFGGDEE